MDFRSQLSALSNTGGRGGGSGRSPGRGGNSSNSNNNNNNNSHYGRGGGSSGGGGGGRGGDYGTHNTNNNRNNNNYNNNSNSNDRRRPGNWDHNDRRDGGPPTSRRRHNSPDRDGLTDLRDLGYRIPKRRQQQQQQAPPVAETTTAVAAGDAKSPAATSTTARSMAIPKKTKHLALLAISIDDLPYEHIWKAWSQTVGEDEDLWISLICHAKYPKRVKSPWLRQRLLVYPPKLGRGNSFADPEFLTHTPKWGSIEITRAMLDLLEDGMRIGHCKREDMRFAAKRYLIKRPAMAANTSTTTTTTIIQAADRIPPVDQFIYISETCLPVRTAQEIFDAIADTNVSWVNGRHRKGTPNTPKNLYESEQFGGINRRLPGQYRWKADQWILLCRNHADLVLGMDRPHKELKHQLWNSFRDINASDEMYFPTCLAMLGLLTYTLTPASTTVTATTTATSTSTSTSTSTTTTTAATPTSTKEGDTISTSVAPAKMPSQEGETPSVSSTKGSDDGKRPPSVQQEVVLKRPVTFTDWSEGMRNPATYTKGLVDFERVAKEARSKGCLLARKFAPYVAVPGVNVEDQVPTGRITVEEWQQAVERMSQNDEKNKPPSKKPSEPMNGDEDEAAVDKEHETEAREGKGGSSQPDSSSGEEEEEEAEEGEHEGENSDGGAEEDEEEHEEEEESDQGETQLE
jgi:hypothetical protein